MAKTFPLLLAAISASLLLLSAFVQTTVIANNEAKLLTSHCAEQMRREKMEHCRQYLRSEMNILMFPNSGNQACCLRECCEMLQSMDDDCVCEAVESMAEKEGARITIRGRGDERQMAGRVLLRKAMQLPKRCGVSTHCEAPTTSTTTAY